MKKLVFFGAAVLIMLIAANCWAAEDANKVKNRPQGQGMKERAARPMDANVPGGPTQGQMRERREKMFQARMGQLKEIRQIAVSEGATKTVEALDKLIAEDEAQFQKMQERGAMPEQQWQRPERGEKMPMGKREGKGTMPPADVNSTKTKVEVPQK